MGNNQIVIELGPGGQLAIASAFDEPHTVYLLNKALQFALNPPKKSEQRIIPATLLPRINGELSGL